MPSGLHLMVSGERPVTPPSAKIGFDGELLRGGGSLSAGERKQEKSERQRRDESCYRCTLIQHELRPESCKSESQKCTTRQGTTRDWAP